jgi:hypothetical protein
MRVTDVQAAVRKLAAQAKRSRVVLCGRRDAATGADKWGQPGPPRA